MIAQTRVGAEQSKGPCQGPSDYLDKKKLGSWEVEAAENRAAGDNTEEEEYE